MGVPVSTSKLRTICISKTNIPILRFSIGHLGPRMAINIVQNILKQHFLQLFQTVTVNGFSPRTSNPFGNGNTERPARLATCLDQLNGMLIGLKKIFALAGDSFQSVIICEGTFIDGYRLIGGIISL
jgi:hypothetical protein